MWAPALHRLAGLGILLLVATLLFGCSDLIPGAKDRRIVANVDEGERQLTLGRPQEARKWFDRAVAVDPHDERVYTGYTDDGEGGIVQAMSLHNDWPDLVSYLTTAINDPKLSGNYRLWISLADAQNRLGQKAASRVSYQRELVLFTGSALKKGSELSSMDPADYLLNKATAEWGAGDQQQAVDDFHKMIQRYPEQAMYAQNALAYNEAVSNIRLRESLTLAQQAVDAARQSGADDETLGEFLDTLGWAEYQNHMYSGAARDLEEAIGDIPRESVSHYHLGVVYHAMGDNDEALIELQRSAAMDPSSPDTQVALREIPTAPVAPGASKV